MLDQETMRTFVKVAECQGFSKAAELLHKTPAAISYRIKSLENSLGIMLFHRTTRTVSLTLAGKHLYERCYQWLTWLENMPHELQQINDGVERHVNIAVNNLLYDANAVADLLAYLKTRYTFTHFHFSRHVFMGVWDALLNTDIHLAIGASGWESLDNMISVSPFGEMSWVFAVSRDHPLAQLSGRLTNDMLRPFPAINVEDTAVKMHKRVAWLLPGQTEMRVPDMKTKIACHLRGLGIGFLPKNRCQYYLDSGELVECQVINARKPSPLSLAWKKNQLGRAMHDIVQLFQTRHPIIAGFLKNMDNTFPAKPIVTR